PCWASRLILSASRPSAGPDRTVWSEHSRPGSGTSRRSGSAAPGTRSDRLHVLGRAPGAAGPLPHHKRVPQAVGFDDGGTRLRVNTDIQKISIHQPSVVIPSTALLLRRSLVQGRLVRQPCPLERRWRS